MTNQRETGVRIPKPSRDLGRTHDEAGENDKGGLAQAASETNDKTRQSDQTGTMEGSPQSDAKGAKSRSQGDSINDGVASADPKVLSGNKSGDATFEHTFDGIDKE